MRSRLFAVLLLPIITAAGLTFSACRPAAPPSPSCAGTVSGNVINVVWSTILVAPGPRYGVGDPARANRIAWFESRCQAGERNSNGCIGLFQLCRHNDAWQAAYGQNGCAQNPTPGNPWCDAWAGYILWWNGGSPSWSPWNGDPGNF